MYKNWHVHLSFCGKKTSVKTNCSEHNLYTQSEPLLFFPQASGRGVVQRICVSLLKCSRLSGNYKLIIWSSKGNLFPSSAPQYKQHSIAFKQIYHLPYFLPNRVVLALLFIGNKSCSVVFFDYDYIACAYLCRHYNRSDKSFLKVLFFSFN